METVINVGTNSSFKFTSADRYDARDSVSTISINANSKQHQLSKDLSFKNKESKYNCETLTLEANDSIKQLREPIEQS